MMGVAGMVAAITPAISALPGIPHWVEFTRVWGPLVAIVLGILALVRIRASEGGLCGRGWAWTGVVLGAAQLLFWLGLLAILFSGGGHLAK